MKNLLNTVRSWLDREGKLRTPADGAAKFRLEYDGQTIGILTAAAGKWTFRYVDEFGMTSLRPIVEFPDIAKTYTSDELWPFFVMRIPSLKQAAVQEIVKSEQIDDTDEIELLRRFGKRTVSNPFELVEG